MVSIDDFITQRARQFSLENQRSGPMSGTVQSVDVFVIQAGNQLAKRLFKRVGLKQQTIGVAGCRKSINSSPRLEHLPPTNSTSPAPTSLRSSTSRFTLRLFIPTSKRLRRPCRDTG